MNKKLKKEIRHRIEYVCVLVIVQLVRLMSLKTMLRFAQGFGSLAFSLVKVRRKTVLKNLQAAFPEKNEAELTSIAKRTYQNFAKMAFEYISFPKLSREDVLARCEIQNREHLDWLLENGKGGVLVAGHFGNWELMGAALAQLGYPIYFLVGKQHNRYVDNMMNKHREMMGIKIIHMGVAVRGVIKALRNNGFVALLSDQNAKTDGVFVDFFGRPASTPQGPAVFALRTGAPIILGSAIRLPGGKHRLNMELITHEHLTGGVTEENIKTLTQIYTSKLEEKIREYPDHWFWMHKRWKTRPPGERKKV